MKTAATTMMAGPRTVGSGCFSPVQRLDEWSEASPPSTYHNTDHFFFWRSHPSPPPTQHQHQHPPEPKKGEASRHSKDRSFVICQVLHSGGRTTDCY